MLRPESSLRPTSATEQVIRPMPAFTPSGGTAFSAMFGDLRREVNDFIQNGAQGGGNADAGAMLPMSMLSVEGQAVRDGVQSAGARSALGASSETQQAFLESIAPGAQDAAERLGVAPELIAAHAALESGWGLRPLTQADGRSTNNLFGIKAGSSWGGDVTHALTTEIEDGAAVKKVEPFRSYPDQAAAFRDYAQLLLDNPRYRGALNAGSDARSFAEGLARGGYASDPAYADKLQRVAARLMGKQ